MTAGGGRRGIVRAVHILLATDADWIVDDVTAALGGPDTSFTVCRDGARRRRSWSRSTGGDLDVAIFDLQVGSMGGMAITMSLRLDESGGHAAARAGADAARPQADVHLAQRSGADGWLVKPLDPLRLRRAVVAVIAGRHVHRGRSGRHAPILQATPTATPT